MPLAPGAGTAVRRQGNRDRENLVQAITKLRIATRKSQLALWQAEHVRDRLMALHPGLEVELVAMSTRGDKILDTPLAKVGGKGLFVKELRSEERRVGKECRSRWSAGQYKKKVDEVMRR